MSERLTLTFDYDDVLVATVEPIIAHYNAQYGTQLQLEHYYPVGDLPKEYGTTDGSEIGRRINSFLDTADYMDLAPNPEEVASLQRMSEEHELYIVTGRPEYTRERSLEYLERHMPAVFKSVVFADVFATNGRNKGDICRELEADVHIDDHYGHCQKVAALGITALLFGDFPWNRDAELTGNMQRVANIQQVEALVGEYVRA